MFPEGVNYTLIEKICKEGIISSCSINESSQITRINIAMKENEGYYKVETDYGFPFISHKITIKKIPTDRIGAESAKILSASGFTRTIQRTNNIDLGADNKESAMALKSFGSQINYSIQVPGLINEVKFAQEKIPAQGNSITIEFTKLLEKEGELEINSSEINWAYVSGAIAVLVLIAFGATFIFDKKVQSKKENAKKSKIKNE